MLALGLEGGAQVRLWYVGRADVELHIARVRARVAKGGHAIPEAKIRERFDRGREHLIALLPRLTEAKVFDNSFEADPALGHRPRPTLVLRTQGVLRELMDPQEVPDWAKPIAMAALRLPRTGRPGGPE